MRKNLHSKLMLLLAAVLMGVGSVSAAEEVYKTALFGSTYNSKGVSGYTDVSFTANNAGFIVTATNFNNNNNGWNFIKCGGKKGAYTGTITTNDKIDEAITKVAVTIDAITSGNVTSIKLYTSTDNSTWTEAGTFDKSTGTKEVTLTSPAANLYYKIEFVCTQGSSNGLVTVSKVEYYYVSGGNPSCATPTFSPEAGTYTSAQNVEISTTTNGATIYYTTDGSDPTTSSNVYSSAISVSSTTTIKAMAVASGYVNSSIAEATYTIVSLSHAGTEADPYTVADAHTAIDANTGVTNVYATGIVSKIVTAYNSDYKNISFDIVDEAGSSTTLQAYRCKGSEAANVQEGDVVVVYGTLKKYNTTYEFGQDCELVSLTHPASTDPAITVDPVTVNVTAEGGDGTLSLTYENITNFISFDFSFCDAQGNELQENPDWIVGEIQVENDSYSLYYLINANDGEARTAYIKVYTFDDNSDEVATIVTITQAAYVAPALDYATLPFAFDGGSADIENTEGLTQYGLGSDYSSSPKLKFDGTGDYLILKVNERPGTLAFNIKGNGFSNSTFKVQTSEDGQTYTDLATYTELTSTTKSEEFNNLSEDVRYIKWIYTEKDQGNVALGNIKLTKYAASSITLEETDIQVTAEEFEGTINVTYNNITNVAAEVQFCDAKGEEATYDWVTAEISNNDNNLYYTIEANESVAPRTAYMKVYALDDEANDVYSELITITQDAYVAPGETEDYELFTGDLVEGDYIIYYNGYALKNAVENSRLMYELVTPKDDVISTGDATIVWHLAKSGDYWTIYNADADAYAAGTGVKNKAQMLADGTDDKALWTVSGTGTYEFVNKNNAADGVNANLRNNGTYGFACYATGTGGALSLYKKVASVASVTVTDAGWATYIAEDNVTFHTGVAAYIATKNTESSVTLTEVLAVAKGTPVVVNAEAGTYELKTVNAEDCADVSGNMFIVYNAKTPELEEGVNLFVLAKNASDGSACFKQWIGEMSDLDGRVVLPLKLDLNSPNAVRALTIVFGGETTGIETVSHATPTMSEGAYTLSGQRVQKPTKGLYIIGGKKVVVK